MNTRATTDVLRDTISRETGFDNGELFASEEQVREYFTAENMAAMFGPDVDVPDDATLDAWAEIVIDNRWHCDF